MDEGVETKVYFADGTEKVINVKTVVVPKAGFDQEDYNKDNTEATNKADVYTKAAANGSKSKALVDSNFEVVSAANLSANTLYAYEQDGSDYTLFVLDKGNYASNDVKASTTVAYNDKTETFSGTEAEDAAPIFIRYSTDSYKVITGSALKSYKTMTGTGSSVLLADGDNVVAAYIDLGSGKLSTSDTLYGVVKKFYKGTESNGSDTVVYIDMITSEGLKTVETEETTFGSLHKGVIVSFTGTYEKANDDLAIVSGGTMTTGSTENLSGYIAIANDWSDSSKLVRAYDVYATSADVANPSKVIKVAAGKVVSDSVVINIDEDDYKADDATPSKAEEFETATTAGYYANAFVIVNSDNEIELLVYETSNRIKDNNNKEIKLYTK